MLPLEGIRVLDMTVVWAGPYCTALLSALGAEVIRVETTNTFVPLTRGIMARPARYQLERLMLFQGGLPDREPGQRPWNRYPIFNAHSSNKLSMTVNLKAPDGLEIFKRLVSKSDVLVENNVTETMGKLGISYEMLKEQKNDFIMLRMPAYGSTGPYSNYRAFGVHIEGVIGHSVMRGYTDMDPSSNTAVYVADAAGGAQGAFAVLAALNYRRRTGKGQLVELSLTESALPYFGEMFMDYFMNNRNPERLGNRHPYAVQGCYPCKGEDRWLNITIFNDKEWDAFCKVLGNPSWARDDKFSGVTERRRNQDDLDPHIAEWSLGMGNVEAARLLQEAGVPAGPVMDQRDAVNDPHANERGFFEEIYQEDCGVHKYPGAPFRFSNTDTSIRRGPVRLGEDNEYVYRTVMGYSEEEYADFVRQGHIGTEYDPGV